MYAKSRARPAVIVLNAGANAVCWCAASPLTCESRLECAVERGSARAHAPCPALQSARPAARACRPPRPPPPTSAAAQRLSSNCAPQRRSRATHRLERARMRAQEHGELRRRSWDLCRGPSGLKRRPRRRRHRQHRDGWLYGARRTGQRNRTLQKTALGHAALLLWVQLVAGNARHAPGAQ